MTTAAGATPTAIDLHEANEQLDVLAPSTPLACETVERLALGSDQLDFSSDAIDAMERSADILAAAHNRGDEIYGLTTGFGPHVRYAADTDANRQGCGLISHLAAGFGPPLARPLVRAILATRLKTIAQGRSGIATSAGRAMLDLFNAGICPRVPSLGSVGASGDLIPLAHAARTLTGEGRVINEDGTEADAVDALAAAGLEPIELSGRDALALVNGTAFMTAHAALAVACTERLIEFAERLTGLAFRTLRGRNQCLDPRLHAARGHAGQCQSARTIAHHAGDYDEDLTRPLQEVYSLRCAPQILGACRDQLAHARRVIETELAGTNDNPVICGTPDDPAVLHGGNFQGQQVAFAADTLNQALTQAALLIERQLDVLLAPDLNGGAPLLLAWEPGATSGLAGLQITATALAAELRRCATPSAIATIPTNGRNQDIVSMGAMAARVAYEQTDRAAAVIAAHAIALHQMSFLRAHGRAPGGPFAMPSWAGEVGGVRDDRPLEEDTARLAELFLSPPAG